MEPPVNKQLETLFQTIACPPTIIKQTWKIAEAMKRRCREDRGQNDHKMDQFPRQPSAQTMSITQWNRRWRKVLLEINDDSETAATIT